MILKYFRHSLTLLFENFSKMNLYEQRDLINEQICKLIEEREKDLVFGADETSGSAPPSLDDLRGELDEAKQYLESAKNSLRILAEIYQQRTEDAQEVSISDRREKFEEMKRDYAEKISTMGRLEAEVRRVDKELIAKKNSTAQLREEIRQVKGDSGQENSNPWQVGSRSVVCILLFNTHSNFVDRSVCRMEIEVEEIEIELWTETVHGHPGLGAIGENR